jgi:hypothetical protein
MRTPTEIVKIGTPSVWEEALRYMCGVENKANDIRKE